MKQGLTVMLLGAWMALFMPAMAVAQDAAATFKKEEIEQLVAPIALYPDPLIAQILMASTYPLEVVEAARWLKANPKVQGDALEKAMEGQKWDPSVKSLTAFPQVLTMLNEKLDMTQKLGDAFLAQQKEVMDAIQRLRGKAEQAGNLKSGKEQTVTTTKEDGATVIKIEPAQPTTVYVPTYNPTVVYGPWPYAAYPPYYYYPPGYVAGAAFFSFTVGVVVGNALWGHCNWGRGDVNINVNKYNSFNKTNISNNNWQHNAEHRKGVQYRDQASQQKFGKGQREGAQSREQFRGRAEQGRQEIARGGADDLKGRMGAADGLKGNASGAGALKGNVGGGDGARNTVSSQRAGGHDGAFSGAGQGAHTLQSSSRGAASRASAAGHARGGGHGGGGRRR